MAGVLEQFRRPFSKRAELYGSGFVPIDPRTQQLQEAKEILAEIFEVDTSEVEEMIRRRMEERTWRHSEEEELWPEMLWVKS